MTLESALLFRKCSIKQSDIQYDILKTFEIHRIKSMRRIRTYKTKLIKLIEKFYREALEKLYFIDK